MGWGIFINKKEGADYQSTPSNEWMFLPSLLEGAEDAIVDREFAMHRMHVAGNSVDKAISFSLPVQLDLRFLFVVQDDDVGMTDRVHIFPVAWEIHGLADEAWRAFDALYAEFGLEDAGDGACILFLVEASPTGEAPFSLVRRDGPLHQKSCPVHVCDDHVNAQARGSRVDVFVVLVAQPICCSFQGSLLFQRFFRARFSFFVELAQNWALNESI